MKKIFLQALITTILFVATLFFLRKVDWMTVFKIEKLTQKTQQKIGDIFWETIQQTEKVNTDVYANNCADSIVTKICVANNIDRKLIKVHIVDKDEVNAFAIPNGHLVVYSGLIKKSDNADEVAGVIAHEIAHTQLDHLTKNLIKEMGLSALLSISAGSAGGEVIKRAIKILSSTAYDRKLEKEADIKAVDYLLNCNINPEYFSNFLYKISDEQPSSLQNLTWISTHPDSKERAKYIMDYMKGKQRKFTTILSTETWVAFQKSLKEKE